MVNRKKSPEKKRSHITKIAFTDREFDEQFGLAKAAGMPLAVYCRLKIVSRNGTIAPLIHQQILAQLSTQTNDIADIKKLLILANQKNSRIPSRVIELLENELAVNASLKETLGNPLKTPLKDSLLGENNHEIENGNDP